MNEPLSPHMPATGTQIFCVQIRQGKLSVTQAGTVRDRSGFKLTSEEYTTTHGSRYHLQNHWPGGTPCGFYPETFPHDSIFMYCTEQGKLGAVDRLKADYVLACIKAEEALQERARTLHQYASDASQIEL